MHTFRYYFWQDCLTIFGSGGTAGGQSGYEAHTALKMTYDGQGHPLRLL